MLIIAECGCNWESLEQAKEMIRRSKDVGCFASKFQLFTKEVVSGLLEHLYLTFEQAKELFDYGKSIGQEVFFTCMYPEAVEMCEKIRVNYYKIRHKDRYNEQLIIKIWSTEKPYFISLDLNENHYSYRSICYNLYCIPKYPVSGLEYTNMTIGDFLYRHFSGISDHSQGAVLLRNANFFFKDRFFIEKHMKLDGIEPLENDWSISFKELGEILNHD